MQLGLWGIDYFDLFLVHFPIALQYVDPSHRYPPEWFGDDGKVHLGEYIFLNPSAIHIGTCSQHSHAGDLDLHGAIGR